MTMSSPVGGRPPLQPIDIMLSRFMRAFMTQVRVVQALAVRDLVSQFGNSRLISWMVVLRPIGTVTVTIGIATLSQRLTPQYMPVYAFIITGYLPWYAFVRTYVDIGMSNASGVLHFPNVTHLDVYMSRMVVDWGVYSVVFGLFIVFGALFNQMGGWPDTPLGVIYGFYSCWFFGVLLGIMQACLARVTRFARIVRFIVRRGGLAISGVFTVGTAFPQSVLVWLSWNPLFHCFELIRECWWPVYVSPFASPLYIFQCQIGLTLFALLVERVSRPRERT